MSKVISIANLDQMKKHKAYAENRGQQVEMKLALLKEIEAAYGERYVHLKEGTRNVIETMCGLGASRGFVLTKETSLANRFHVSYRTVRGISKFLRDSGLILTVYRFDKGHNGRGAPIHLFVHHPYFAHWCHLLNLTPDSLQEEKKERENHV